MAEGLLQDIKDFHDVVRLLEQHPEWRADLRRLILTEELLALPEQIAQLTRQMGVDLILSIALHGTIDRVFSANASLLASDKSVLAKRAFGPL